MLENGFVTWLGFELSGFSRWHFLMLLIGAFFQVLQFPPSAHSEGTVRRRWTVLGKLTGTTWEANERILKTLNQGTVPHLTVALLHGLPPPKPNSKPSTESRTRHFGSSQVQWDQRQTENGKARRNPALSERTGVKNLMLASVYQSIL